MVNDLMPRGKSSCRPKFIRAGAPLSLIGNFSCILLLLQNWVGHAHGQNSDYSKSGRELDVVPQECKESAGVYYR